MFNPKPFGKGNPCPVCGNDDGDCRYNVEDTDFIMCHRFVDARKGEKVNDYVCVKSSGGGHTASFKPDNSEEWTLEKRWEWEAQKLERQRKQEADELRERERSLSADERHKLYSEILSGLTLDLVSIDDLKRRGFTGEEIQLSGFKSVVKGQKLSKQYDTRLPGIGPDGKSLAITGSGYLCPLRDFEGRIIGLQLRLHNPEDGNRYRWLSTPDRATLKLQPENENPLSVFHPPSGDALSLPLGKPEFIAIVEGTGCKPFYVSERLNAVVIGAAGGQWLSSPKLLEKYIQAAIDKYGDLPIKVIPDAGWALNSHVKQKLAETFDWLKDNFSQSTIYVLDWNQLHKSQGDIDELDDLSIVRTLKVKSFLKKYKEVFASKRYQNWAESRVKLTADIVQYEKWLTIPEGIQNECDILLIRKSLGGGKTQGLIEFLQPLNIVSLLIGYRNSLLHNTVFRANNSGLNALHIKDAVEVNQGNRINLAADDSVKLWAGCADSFFKFNAITEHNSEYYFIHDEICSVLDHLKGGGTLKGRQQQAIEWDVNTIRNSKFAIMMDANLNDSVVEFYRQSYPEKRIKVLDSIHSINPRTFYFLETTKSDQDYTTNPKYLPSQLVEIALGVNRVLWISDSQRSCEVIDEILTKQGHKHFRLDGKTSHSDLSKQLQSNPKLFITSEKLDSLAISPSGESGLSIDLYDYFDAVCFDIRGTVLVNTLTQISARLRDTQVPIYVACPEFVNMTSDPCPYAIKNVSQVISERIDMLQAQAMEVDHELINSQFVADMFDEMGQKFANDPWFVESLKDAKQLKYEHQNLKLTFKTALAQAGHRVIDLTEEASEELYYNVQQTKEEVKRREADKTFDSPDIEWEKAQELSKKDVDYDTKCKIRKAQLKHKLPGIEETPSWSSDFIYTTLIDKPQFLDKRWRLKQLQDEELFKAIFKSQNSYNFEHGFTPYDVWKSTSTKVEALKLLGVGRIISSGSFCCQDDWLRAIVDEYYSNSHWFNLIGIPKAYRLLNSDGTPQNLHYVKNMVDKFLDFFGLECKQVKKTRTNRYYQVKIPKAVENFIDDIDRCLTRRAERVVCSSQNLSLFYAVNKAADKASSMQKLVETQLIHNNSELVASSPSIYNNQDKDATTDIEQVEGCASLVQECIHDPKVGGYETILALTERWTEKFKTAVWNLLSAAERDFLWRMKYSS